VIVIVIVIQVVVGDATKHHITSPVTNTLYQPVSQPAAKATHIITTVANGSVV